MNIEIKGYDCIQHDPISEWIPENIYDIDVWLTFSIGIQGRNGLDYFEAHFVTPNNQSKYSDTDKFFIIDKYDLKCIVNTIKMLIVSIDEKTWEKTARKINNNLYWEFDSYHKYK